MRAEQGASLLWSPCTTTEYARPLQEMVMFPNSHGQVWYACVLAASMLAANTVWWAIE